jgi:uncharacterized protein with HEPN domain
MESGRSLLDLVASGRTLRACWARRWTCSAIAASARTCASAYSPRPFPCERRARLPAPRIDAIDAILGYTVDGRDAFFADRRTQDAVIRNIEIIGQAVKGVSEDTRGLEPDVPWRQIAGMRDKLIHEDFGVDLNSSGMSSSATSPRFVQPLRL